MQIFEKPPSAGRGLNLRRKLCFDTGNEVGQQLRTGSGHSEVGGHVVPRRLKGPPDQEVFLGGTKPEPVIGKQSSLRA